MFKSKYLLLATLVLIFSFVLGACAPAAEQPAVEEPVVEEPVVEEPAVEEPVVEEPVVEEPVVEEAETILMAWSGPLTGPFVNEGTPNMHGWTLAIDDWNDKGGVLGKQIETLVVDDSNDVEKAVAGAQLAAQQGAISVSGFFFSNVGIAARPTITNNNMIFGPAGITAPDVIGTAENPNLVFRTIGLASEVASLTAKYMLEELGLTRVAVLHDRDDWGRSQAQIVYDVVDADPNAEALMFEGITVGESDFSAIGTRIIAADADSVYFGGHYQEMAGLLNYLRDLGWQGRFLGPDSLRADFPTLAGANAEGTIFVEGAGPTALESGKDFVTRFTARWPEDSISTSAMTNYLSADLILRGVEAVGSTDDPEAIVEWIRSNTHDTIMGTIFFDETGEILGFPWIVQEFIDGGWVTVATYDAQTESFVSTQ